MNTILLGWTMLHFLWLGAALLLVAAVVRLALRRAGANVRYLHSLATLLALAALPVAIATWLLFFPPPSARESEFAEGGWGRSEAEPPAMLAEIQPQIIELNPDYNPPESAQPISPPPTSAGEGLGEGGNAAEYAGGFAALRPQPPGDTGRASGTLERALAYIQTAVPYLPYLWLLGTPITFALLATGLIGAERMRRNGTLLTDGPVYEACQRLRASLRITRKVALAVCDRVAQPVLVGIVRPLILLPPAALAGWSPEQLEMVLLHELAHVRRWDNLVNLAQRSIESLLFFHPAVWIASTWVRRDREDCCDAVVVTRTQEPKQYAELLIALASPQPLAGAALARHPLAGRLRRILKLEDEPMLVSRNTIGLLTLAVVAIALVVISGPLRVQGEGQAVEETAVVDSPPPTEGEGVGEGESAVEIAEATQLPWETVPPTELTREEQIAHRAEELLRLKLAPATDAELEIARKHGYNGGVKIINFSTRQIGVAILTKIESQRVENLEDVDNVLRQLKLPTEGAPTITWEAIREDRGEFIAVTNGRTVRMLPKYVAPTPYSPNSNQLSTSARDESIRDAPALSIGLLSDSEDSATKEQLKKAFKKSFENPETTETYAVSAKLHDQLQQFLEGIQKDPFGPKLTPFTYKWNANDTVEIMAPKKAHEFFFARAIPDFVVLMQKQEDAREAREAGVEASNSLPLSTREALEEGEERNVENDQNDLLEFSYRLPERRKSEWESYLRSSEEIQSKPDSEIGRIRITAQRRRHLMLMAMFFGSAFPDIQAVDAKDLDSSSEFAPQLEAIRQLTGVAYSTPRQWEIVRKARPRLGASLAPATEAELETARQLGHDGNVKIITLSNEENGLTFLTQFDSVKIEDFDDVQRAIDQIKVSHRVPTVYRWRGISEKRGEFVVENTPVRGGSEIELQFVATDPPKPSAEPLAGIAYPSPREGDIAQRAWKELELKIAPATDADLEHARKQGFRGGLKVVGGKPKLKNWPYIMTILQGVEIRDFDDLEKALNEINALNPGNVEWLGMQGEKWIEVIMAREQQKPEAKPPVEVKVADKEAARETYSRTYDVPDNSEVLESLEEWIQARKDIKIEPVAGFEDRVIISATKDEHEHIAKVLTPVSPNLPFLPLEKQKIADRAYKLLGIELEPLSKGEVEDVKKAGFDGGLRITALEDAHPGPRGGLGAGDILVGLHVWPVTTFESLEAILKRPDLAQLSPLKYYVVRPQPPDTGGPTQLVDSGRITINMEALNVLQRRDYALKEQAALNSEPVRKSQPPKPPTPQPMPPTPGPSAPSTPGAIPALAVSPAEIKILREQVKIFDEKFKNVDALFKNGAKGGSAERRFLAAYELAVARGELALAEGNRKEALTHFEDAQKQADEAAKAAELAFQNDFVTYDFMLQSIKNLTEIKLKVIQLKAGKTISGRGVNGDAGVRGRIDVEEEESPSDSPPLDLPPLPFMKSPKDPPPASDPPSTLPTPPPPTPPIINQKSSIINSPPVYRYDGKTFQTWRDTWKHELSTEKRIEAVKALAAFGRAGYAKEAAETILDVAGEYDFGTSATVPAGKSLRGAIVASLAGRESHIDDAAWFPMFMERFEKQPEKWQGLLADILRTSSSLDATFSEQIEPLTKHSISNVRSAALTWLLYHDLKAFDAKVKDALGDPDAHVVQDALRLLATQQHRLANEAYQKNETFSSPLDSDVLLTVVLHNDPTIQKAARTSLKSISTTSTTFIGAEMAGSLANITANKTFPQHHLPAIRALAAIGENAIDAAPQLESIIRESDDLEIRVAAAVALDHIYPREHRGTNLLFGEKPLPEEESRKLSDLIEAEKRQIVK